MPWNRRQRPRHQRLEQEDEHAVQRDQGPVGRGREAVIADVDGKGHEGLVEEGPDQHDQHAEGDERTIAQRRPERLGLLVPQLRRPRLGNAQPDDPGVGERGGRVADEEQVPAVSRQRAAQRAADGEAEVDRPVEDSVGARAIA